MKKWLVENKIELLVGGIIISTVIALFGILYSVILSNVLDEAINIMEDQNVQIEALHDEVYFVTGEMEYYFVRYNEMVNEYEMLLEEYSDVVPKDQYLQEIEFLESVILELRYQCELECGTYNK